MKYYLYLDTNLGNLFKHTPLYSNHNEIWNKLLGNCFTAIAVPDYYNIIDIPCFDSTAIYMLELNPDYLNIIGSLQLDSYTFIQDNYASFPRKRLDSFANMIQNTRLPDEPHVCFISDLSLQYISHIYYTSPLGWSECTFTEDTLYYN